MTMAIEVRVEVNAPIERVFDVFCDVPNAARRISAITKIEMLTPGPVGKGTKWRETRSMFKKEATEELEVVEYDRNKLFKAYCDSCGSDVWFDFRFHSRGSAKTEVVCEMSHVPRSFFAKLMSPLGKLMGGMMKKCVEKDFAELKAVCESQGPSA